MLKKVCLPVFKANTTPLYSIASFQIPSRPFANKAKKKFRREKIILPEDKQEYQVKYFNESFYKIYPKKEKPGIDDDDRLAKGYVPPEIKEKRKEKLIFDYKDQTQVVMEHEEAIDEYQGGDSRSLLEDVDAQTPETRERNVDKEVPLFNQINYI